LRICVSKLRKQKYIKNSQFCFILNYHDLNHFLTLYRFILLFYKCFQNQLKEGLRTPNGIAFIYGNDIALSNVHIYCRNFVIDTTRDIGKGLNINEKNRK